MPDLGRRIVISIGEQRLRLYQGTHPSEEYPVSTALLGPGEEFGSSCTPCGRHRIKIKIGEGCPVNSVFVARRPTGEIYRRELAQQFPERDWILTRIIWLTGLESGKNRGGLKDTLKRFIYIHGTPDSEPMGVPLSHGCIRMRNEDLIGLFDKVETGDLVEIIE